MSGNWGALMTEARWAQVKALFQARRGTGIDNPGPLTPPDY
jgi:hypothetical protein